MQRRGENDETQENAEKTGKQSKEIARALRESAATRKALARRRERLLMDTLERLLDSSENWEVLRNRVAEKFGLKENDPRWQAIRAAWDAHVNPR